ncbi:DUF3987 domain-containing protein [Roseobacter weihaiensis]|uniref:DUF3987 domain-containing protein n=1 Tax=Roseobacter weihaiensis TaxID=2763262 RepID=UPI001D0BB0FC|nr:DUF3987 domain-containing protein [Roseobacter sp. H9]
MFDALSIGLITFGALGHSLHNPNRLFRVAPKLRFNKAIDPLVRAYSGGDGDVIETDAPQAPMAPIIPRKVLSDVTYEGLLHHFEDGDPSVGIFSDEGGQIFGGHAMSKDNQLKTSAGLSKLWDALLVAQQPYSASSTNLVQ